MTASRHVRTFVAIGCLLVVAACSSAKQDATGSSTAVSASMTSTAGTAASNASTDTGAASDMTASAGSDGAAGAARSGTTPASGPGHGLLATDPECPSDTDIATIAGGGPVKDFAGGGTTCGYTTDSLSLKLFITNSAVKSLTLQSARRTSDAVVKYVSAHQGTATIDDARGFGRGAFVTYEDPVANKATVALAQSSCDLYVPAPNGAYAQIQVLDQSATTETKICGQVTSFARLLLS